MQPKRLSSIIFCDNKFHSLPCWSFPMYSSALCDLRPVWVKRYVNLSFSAGRFGHSEVTEQWSEWWNALPLSLFCLIFRDCPAYGRVFLGWSSLVDLFVFQLMLWLENCKFYSEEHALIKQLEYNHKADFLLLHS